MVNNGLEPLTFACLCGFADGCSPIYIIYISTCSHSPHSSPPLAPPLAGRRPGGLDGWDRITGAALQLAGRRRSPVSAVMRAHVPAHIADAKLSREKWHRYDLRPLCWGSHRAHAFSKVTASLWAISLSEEVADNHVL